MPRRQMVGTCIALDFAHADLPLSTTQLPAGGRESLADGPFGYDAVYKPFSRLWRRDMVATQYEYYNTSEVIRHARHTPRRLALSIEGLESASWVIFMSVLPATHVLHLCLQRPVAIRHVCSRQGGRSDCFADSVRLVCACMLSS